MIEVKNICKAYGENIIFNHLNLKIETGSMNAIVGKSGSGKTTLLNIIGLLEDFDEGEVLIEGQPIVFQSKEATMTLRFKISYLFQNFALIDSMSVIDNLKIALEYKDMKKKEKMKCIKEALEKVGLANYENRKIYTLSGGQQQRVAIARVIIKDSPIVLCDEPTGSLDHENAQDIMNILKEMCYQGKTVVIVTHDNHISQQCDRIIELSK
ncbi:putative bacteriocin export ABC transporter [Candidatus Stoquefichus sp. SB1]|uniref:putative bacteriocin export ABC transporter n=1 Tax=Candidatus Stoquefichus sp. SB1 TaxID=1658109 RepID=UPI00067F312D|nr:putative bacteriocin export ABC transporter [Candidatus Stoquefichus sp. SB1]